MGFCVSASRIGAIAPLTSAVSDLTIRHYPRISFCLKISSSLKTNDLTISPSLTISSSLNDSSDN